jgi:hypothetical protein
MFKRISSSALAAILAVGVLATGMKPAEARGSREKTYKAATYGLGALAVLGAVKGNVPVAVVGAAGAYLANKKAKEEERRDRGYGYWDYNRRDGRGYDSRYDSSYSYNRSPRYDRSYDYGTDRTPRYDRNYNSRSYNYDDRSYGYGNSNYNYGNGRGSNSHRYGSSTYGNHGYRGSSYGSRDRNCNDR